MARPAVTTPPGKAKRRRRRCHGMNSLLHRFNLKHFHVILFAESRTRTVDVHVDGLVVAL